ncbi:MAG: TlpA family protein disulfide reductase [Reichenbachiella sp.]
MFLLGGITLCYSADAKGDSLSFQEFREYTFPELHTSKAVAIKDIKTPFIIIDFWASWCVPCKKALPFIDSLSSKKVTVIAMSLDEKKEKARSFYSALGENTVLLHDVDRKSAKLFRIEGLPTVIMLTNNGTLLRRWDGYSYADKQFIQEMVAREERGQ